MIENHEAMAILAIISGEERGIRFPHNKALQMVASQVLHLVSEYRSKAYAVASMERKLEEKVRSCHELYLRMSEKENAVRDFAKLHSWKVFDEEKPADREERYLVKEPNGNVKVDVYIAGADGQYRFLNTAEVHKWAIVPEDVEADEMVELYLRRRRLAHDKKRRRHRRRAGRG